MPFRCDGCPQPSLGSYSTTAPGTHTFNYDIIVDVLEMRGADTNRFSRLPIVCDGATFRLVVMVEENGG